MVHDDYGQRVAIGLGRSVDVVRHPESLASQHPTEAAQERRANLGRNGDSLDPSALGAFAVDVDVGG